MVLYQNYIRHPHRPTKMAATAELTLTWDHMGNSLKNLLVWNCWANWNQTLVVWSSGQNFNWHANQVIITIIHKSEFTKKCHIAYNINGTSLICWGRLQSLPADFSCFDIIHLLNLIQVSDHRLTRASSLRSKLKFSSVSQWARNCQHKNDNFSPETFVILFVCSIIIKVTWPLTWCFLVLWL